MAIVGGLFAVAFLFPFLIWFGEALVVSWLANEKGRDGLWWLLVALFLGPIALLAVGFAPRGTGRGYNLCPACREPISARADVCPYCRASLSEDDTEENPYLRRPNTR